MGSFKGRSRIGVNLRYLFAGYKTHSFLYFMRTKFLKYALVVLLVALVGYTMLHPVDKVKTMLFLTRNCTLEVVVRERNAVGGWRKIGEQEMLRIDGDWILYAGRYYRVEDGKLCCYYQNDRGYWQRELSQEIGGSDKNDVTGLGWLDKSNWKRVKGKLFVWELTDDTANVFDGLTNVRIKRDGLKIAIVGEMIRGDKTYQVAIRFTKFGITNIKLPWKE